MNSSISLYINSPKKISEQLARYRIRLRKSLGQNFLFDKNIINIIIKSLHLKKQDHIFEIGTGLGALTLALSTQVEAVYSIEKDRQLKPILDDTLLSDKSCINIIYQDVLTFDLINFFKDRAQAGHKIEKITGNLPYSISLHLLRKLISMHKFISLAVVMVQKEVGERMIAQPGNKNYGILSIVSQYYAHIEKIHLVKPGSFFPKPEVDSMIVGIQFLKRPRVLVKDEILFFNLVRAVFQHRRKNIVNALKLYFGDEIDKNQLHKICQRMGLKLNHRGEKFSLLEFARLTEEIKKILPG